MKKTIGLVALVALLFVSGCDGASLLPSGSESSASNESGSNLTSDLEYDADDIKEVFGNNYKVVFTYTDDTANETITEMATDQGFLIQTGSASLMYVKSGDTSYVYCTYDESTQKWVSVLTVDDAEVSTEISNYQGLYISLLFFGYSGYGDSMDNIGTETIAGFHCTKYHFASSVAGLASSEMTYWITDDGLCLKIMGSVTQSGETSSYVYEVTELKIGGNTLPSYEDSGSPTLADSFPSDTVLANYYLSGFTIAGIANATDITVYNDTTSFVLSIEMTMSDTAIKTVFSDVYNKGYSNQYNESAELVHFALNDLWSFTDDVYSYAGYYVVNASSSAEMSITYSSDYFYMTVYVN